MLTIDEAQGRVIVCHDDGSVGGTPSRHARGVRGGLRGLAALRLGREIRLRLHLDGPAGDPVAGGHDPHPGGDLATAAGRHRGNRRRARRFTDLLRQPVRGDGPWPGHRHRYRHSPAQSHSDRGASVGRTHHLDRGQLHRARHAGGGASRHRSRRDASLVVLDSNHSRAHVEAELEAYAPLVSPGSYIVACDGIMAQIAGAPRTAPDWTWNNPIAAVEAFLSHAIPNSCWRSQASHSTKVRCASGSPIGRRASSGACDRIAA